MVIRRALGVDISAVAGGGAAGGLAAGLAAFLGARIESGFEIVARVCDLDGRLAAADVVVTGEGSFDAQSLQGKTTGRLLTRAAEAGKPAVVFAGVASAPGLETVRTLAEIEPDRARSMALAGVLLGRVARDWASRYA
jgi:glycerate kinase